MIAYIRKYIALVLLASIVFAGCARSHESDQSVHRWTGVLADVRVQWYAEPGIELVTGVAVPVRAYLESRLLAQYVGKLDQTYPGFARAVPPNEPQDSPNISARDRQPPLEYPLAAPLFGNITYHIQAVERSGRDVTATVCNFNYAVAKEHDGKFVAFNNLGPVESRGVNTFRVLLTAPAEQSTSALPPQAGPANSPDNDVFGEWKVTGFLVATGTEYVKSHWPNFEADLAACVTKAPDPLERRAYLLNGEHPRSDFPTSPPSPGWPEGTGH
jgi:hypothetical protein